MIQHIYTTYAVQARDIIKACEDLESWSLKEAKKYENITYMGSWIDKVLRIHSIQNPVIHKNSNLSGANVNIKIECSVRFYNQGMILSEVLVTNGKDKIMGTRHGSQKIAIERNDFGFEQGEKIFAIVKQDIVKSFSSASIFGCQLYIPWQVSNDFICNGTLNDIESIMLQLQSVNDLVNKISNNQYVKQWVMKMKLLQKTNILGYEILSLEQVIQDVNIVKDKNVKIQDSHLPYILVKKDDEHQDYSQNELISIPVSADVMLFSAIERTLILMDSLLMLDQDDVSITNQYEKYLSIVDQLSAL